MATKKQATHRAKFAKQARAGKGKVGKAAKISAAPKRKGRGK